MVVFDEYHHAEIRIFAAYMCLTLGAWFYFCSKGRGKRIMALICGTITSMWVVALAKWALIPLQKWLLGDPVSPSETSRWVGPSSAIIGWVGRLIVLLAPALILLLPKASRPIVPEQASRAG
jgi:hypothetical protein